MKVFLFTIGLLTLLCTATMAEYQIREFDPIPNYDSQFLELTYRYNTDGYNFSQIFKLIKFNHDDLSIRILGLPIEMRKELNRYYASVSPTEFKTALASSGNLHNPTLSPLESHISKAIMSTQLYIELDKALKENNYSIIDVHYEKFSIISQVIHLAEIRIKCERAT